MSKKTNRYPIRTALVEWACEIADMPLEKLPITVTKAMQTAKDGVVMLTSFQVERIAKRTDVPYGYLFLLEPPKPRKCFAVPLLSTEESRIQMAELIMDELYNYYVINAKLPSASAIAYLYECGANALARDETFDFKFVDEKIVFTMNNGEWTVLLGKDGAIEHAETNQNSVREIAMDKGLPDDEEFLEWLTRAVRTVEGER